MERADGIVPGNSDVQKGDAKYRKLSKGGIYTLLFSDDEKMARSALTSLSHEGRISINQAAHWAMNVGHRELSDILYDKLKEHGKNSNSVRGLKFRRERKKRNKNCYQNKN